MLNVGRCYRQVLPVALTPFFWSLKQSAINQYLRPIFPGEISGSVYQVFRSGHSAGGTKKLNVGQKSSTNVSLIQFVHIIAGVALRHAAIIQGDILGKRR